MTRICQFLLQAFGWRWLRVARYSEKRDLERSPPKNQVGKCSGSERLISSSPNPEQLHFTVQVPQRADSRGKARDEKRTTRFMNATKNGYYFFMYFKQANVARNSGKVHTILYEEPSSIGFHSSFASLPVIPPKTGFFFA